MLRRTSLSIIIACLCLRAGINPQPRINGSIAWSNPLTNGLVWCIAPASATAGGAFDYLKTRISTGTGTNIGPQWANLQEGFGAENWLFSQASTTDLDWTSGAFTVGAFFRIPQVQANSTGMEIVNRANYVSESNNQGWAISITPPNAQNGFRWTVFRNNGTANYSLDSTTHLSVTDFSVFGTSDGTTRRIYVNGVQEATTTNNANPVSNTTSGLTSKVGTGSPTGQLYIYIAYIWSRELTAGEIHELSLDPYAVLTKTRILNMDMTGGSVGGVVNNPVVFR